MTDHRDDCDCESCEAEDRRRRQLILDAIASGKVTEDEVWEVITPILKRKGEKN